MSSIDNRIVQMEFDNDEFEKRVGTTLNTLGNLDNSIERLGGNSFSSIADGIQDIADRFSVMGIVGMAAIERITERIVDMGINLVQSMSIDQIASGFKKFEDITTSTVAIVNQADVSFSEAGKYIEQLSWYSDMTSFSLSNMVSALKSFSAQNIPLEESIGIIMGIGNSVTYAGQSAQQGSAAFDVYSKAIANGYLGYREWFTLSKSLGVGTYKFRNQLLEAGVAMGTLKKNGDGTYTTLKGLTFGMEGFMQSLNDQKGKWATTDVLKKVFADDYGKYTMNLAAATLEYQKQTGEVLTLTEAMEKFGDAADEMGEKYLKSATIARTYSEAIDAVKDAASTQFKSMFEYIFGMPEEAMILWTEFSDFLNGLVVGPIASVTNKLEKWYELGGRDTLYKAIKNVGSALSDIIAPAKYLVNEVIPHLNGEKLKAATDAFNRFSESLIAFGANFKNAFAEDFGDYTTDVMDDAVENFGKLDPIIRNLKNALRGFGSILNIVKEAALGVIEPAKKLATPIANLALSLSRLFGKIGSNISNFDSITNFTEKISKLLNPIADALVWIVEHVTDLIDKLTTLVNGNILSGVFDALSKFLTIFNPIKWVVQGLSAIIKELSNAFWQVSSALGDMLKKVKDLNLAGILLVILSFGKKILSVINDFFAGGKLVKGIVSVTDAINKLKTALGSITDGITDAIASFSNKNSMEAIKSVAISLGILAASLWVLGQLDVQQIVVGITALAGCLFLLSESMKSMTASNNSEIAKKGILSFGESLGGALNASKLIALAGAVAILAASMKMIQSLDINQLVGSGLAISALLWELVAIMKLSSTFKPAKLKGVTALAVGVLVLAAAVKMLSKIDTDAMWQGFTAITMILFDLGLFATAMSLFKVKSLFGVGAGLLLVAAAVDLIVVAVAALGSIKEETLTQGLKGVLAILVEIGAFAALTSSISLKMVGVGAALVLFAGALLVLAPALIMIGSISADGIVTALMTIALLLAEFGVAAAVLPTAVIAKLAGLSASLILLGAALLALSPGLMLLAGLGLPEIINSFIGLAGGLAVFAAASLLLNTAVIPMLIMTGVILALSAALYALGAALGKIAEAFLVFKVGAKVTVDDIKSDITSKVNDTTKEVESKVTGSLDKVESELETSGENMVDKTNVNMDQLKALAEQTGIDINSLTAMYGDERLKTMDGINTEMLENYIKNAGSMVDETSNFGTDIDTTLAGMGPGLGNTSGGLASYVVQGFVNGIKNRMAGIKQQMQELGAGITSSFALSMGIASPSKVFKEFGMYTVEGFAIGLEDYSNVASNATSNLSKNVIDSMGESMKLIDDIASDKFEISPRITPVVDMTNLQNGKNYLDGMFATGSMSATINGNTNASLNAIGYLTNEMAAMKQQIAMMNNNQFTEDQMAAMMSKAMTNVNVYMDSTRVGKMITNYQSAYNRSVGK